MTLTCGWSRKKSFVLKLKDFRATHCNLKDCDSTKLARELHSLGKGEIVNLELKESDETKEDKDYYFMDTAHIGQLYYDCLSYIAQRHTFCVLFL